MPQNEHLVIHMLQFPMNTFSMPPQWFKVVMNVTELRLEKVAATEIKDNAFNSMQFERTEKLEIFNSPIHVLKEGTFNGLANLRELSLHQVKIIQFGRYVLMPVCKHLTKLTVTNCGPHKLNFENLTGTVELPNLQTLQIERCNLADTIGDLTFWGLKNINEMSLMHNAITKISPGSFVVPYKTLEHLYLGTNLLETLPLDIFNSNRSLTINPSQNPWKCECEQEAFRQLLRKTKDTVNFGRVICITPETRKGWVLNSAPNLCYDTDELIEIQKLPNLPDSLNFNSGEDDSFIEMIEKLAEDAILKNITNQNNKVQSNDDEMAIFISAFYFNAADVTSLSLYSGFALFFLCVKLTFYP